MPSVRRRVWHTVPDTQTHELLHPFAGRRHAWRWSCSLSDRIEFLKSCDGRDRAGRGHGDRADQVAGALLFSALLIRALLIHALLIRALLIHALRTRALPIHVRVRTRVPEQAQQQQLLQHQRKQQHQAQAARCGVVGPAGSFGDGCTV